ncbi:MAG: NAD(P)/FAD-dependent oxidoreductase [Planctomycetota bacterium]|nr:NAD(P)/FAD-dependent oxidoreductase [Planctomycetota bacterium]MDA1213228.1 NAD(P)/FAD-dependent oxidoreductase [Planctomycetota bacterium]
MPYDALIIGAGLSGLSAGIRLAYYEKSVCILERHTTIGGLNSFYRLRNRNYDVGLHAVTNYAVRGTKHGPLPKLLRQLRMDWDDFRLLPQCGSAIDFPGCRLHFSNDFAEFRQQIIEAFPVQADGFHRFVQAVNDYDDMSLVPPPRSARMVLAEYLSDPMLIDMILCPLMFYGSATPHDMDFHQFVIMFKSIYYEGFGRPWEGVRHILKRLTKKYKSLGGELRLRGGVHKILLDGDRAVGVELDDGTQLEASTILSSAGSAETMRLCGEDRERNDAHPPGDISFMETLSPIEKQPAELGFPYTILFYSRTPEFHYNTPDEPLDLRSGIICSPNNFQYEKPLDEGMIRITALANPSFWINLSDDDYPHVKQEWTDKLLTAAQPLLPDYRSYVLDTDSFTPRTIRRFTGHLNGCVYGASQKSLAGDTPVRRLFLCGTDQGYLGIIGSMLSGITMANLHVLKGS